MLLSLQDKIIIILIAVLTLGIFGFVIYNQHQSAVQQQAIQTQLVATQQLADNINRAMSSFATTQQLRAFAQQNDVDLQVIQNNLKTLNASLTAISVATANSSGQTATSVPSSGSTPVSTGEPTSTATCNGQTVVCTNPDKYGYLSKEEQLDLNENFPAPATPPGSPASPTATIVPIGQVGFTASQAQPWSVNVAPRAYNLTTTLGTKNDDNGQQVAYNQLIITENGKNYNVPISSNQFVQQVPTPKFNFWNPRLSLGVEGGINVDAVKGEVVPNIGVSLMSYGVPSSNPDWAILGVGVGYGTASKDVQISVAPFSYNLGTALKPLVRDLYIGPTMDIDPLNGNLTFGAGIRVGL
jgi:hypothetical protein